MWQANYVFLSKLGWKLQPEPEDLWSRILRNKYCEGRCDINMFQARSGMSNAWRGIVENIDIMKKGVSMTVGNGHDTLFWKHPWATNVPLIQRVTQPPPTQLLDIPVKDVWDANIRWKMELFTDYLPLDVQQIIDTFELQEDLEAVDRIY